jgi:hypothetical protein
MRFDAALSACLLTTLATGVALAQQSTVQDSPRSAASSSPVAFVYVSRTNPKTVVDALSASANGTLTLVGEVPSANALNHLSVTRKHLFGIDGGSNIYSYSIAANGALKQVAITAAGKYIPDFDATAGGTELQIDESGSDLYVFLADKEQNVYLVSFKIESNGELQYLGKSYANGYASQLRFVQNNTFALSAECVILSESSTFVSFRAQTLVYRRESNGYLTYVDASQDEPAAKSPDQFCPWLAVNDSSDHLAVGYAAIDDNENTIDGYALGTFTASTQGKLSTTSSYENMPITTYPPQVMSISPSGKLLAVAGQGFYQFFHYNGGQAITKYAGPFEFQTHAVLAFGWDKSNHLYLLNDSALIPYSITPTSYKALKSYALFAPYKMIVLSLQ